MSLRKVSRWMVAMVTTMTKAPPPPPPMCKQFARRRRRLDVQPFSYACCSKLTWWIDSSVLQVALVGSTTQPWVCACVSMTESSRARYWLLFFPSPPQRTFFLSFPFSFPCFLFVVLFRPTNDCGAWELTMSAAAVASCGWRVCCCYFLLITASEWRAIKRGKCSRQRQCNQNGQWRATVLLWLTWKCWRWVPVTTWLVIIIIIIMPRLVLLLLLLLQRQFILLLLRIIIIIIILMRPILTLMSSVCHLGGKSLWAITISTTTTNIILLLLIITITRRRLFIIIIIIMCRMAAVVTWMAGNGNVLLRIIKCPLWPCILSRRWLRFYAIWILWEAISFTMTSWPWPPTEMCWAKVLCWTFFATISGVNPCATIPVTSRTGHSPSSRSGKTDTFQYLCLGSFFLFWPRFF